MITYSAPSFFFFRPLLLLIASISLHTYTLILFRHMHYIIELCYVSPEQKKLASLCLMGGAQKSLPAPSLSQNRVRQKKKVKNIVYAINIAPVKHGELFVCTIMYMYSTLYTLKLHRCGAFDKRYIASHSLSLSSFQKTAPSS